MLTLLAILATFRLARLISWDKIFVPMRHFLGRRASGSKIWRFWAELINCPYCLGVWIALFFAWLLWTPETTWRIFFLTWLGIAGGQFVLQNFTEEA